MLGTDTIGGAVGLNPPKSANVVKMNAEIVVPRIYIA